MTTWSSMRSWLSSQLEWRPSKLRQPTSSTSCTDSLTLRLSYLRKFCLQLKQPKTILLKVWSMTEWWSSSIFTNVSMKLWEFALLEVYLCTWPCLKTPTWLSEKESKFFSRKTQFSWLTSCKFNGIQCSGPSLKYLNLSALILVKPIILGSWPRRASLVTHLPSLHSQVVSAFVSAKLSQR